MFRRPRRHHAPAFTATVALAALRGEATRAELAQRVAGHPHQMGQGREQFLAGAATVLAEGRSLDPPVDVQARHAKIGQLTRENDVVDRALAKAGWPSARR